ncbi:HNH endonuclease [[Clostridium] sordellii]|uniref:HNH endonuclease n=1 Tax=Paraclostridium sordellii TaxID=1505 RepID=UPI0005DDB623|nr:HNH endonuclease [Paeniclostridium sordellii]CEP79292.1 HNH endonuclease [[Clostridium] sordellii] [Paeniclostridium sordellii]
MKMCSKCKIMKDESEFHKHSRSQDGLRSVCKECRKIETKEYRSKYREEVLERKRKWYEETKNRKEERYSKAPKSKVCSECGEEKEISEFRKRANGGYYGKCRICENKINRQYAKNNPEIIRQNKVITEQRRRKQAKKVKSTFTRKDWKECKEFFNGVCAYCGKKLTSLTQDHFIPLSKEGAYTKENILPACRTCNSSKHNFDFYEWYVNYEHYSEERIKKIESYFESLNQ